LQPIYDANGCQLNDNDSQPKESKSRYQRCHDLLHDVPLGLPPNVPVGLADAVYLNLSQGDEGLAQKPYESCRLTLELAKPKLTRIFTKKVTTSFSFLKALL